MSTKKFNAQNPAKVGEIISYSGEAEPIAVVSCKKITHWHTDFQGKKHSPIKVYEIGYEVTSA